MRNSQQIKDLIKNLAKKKDINAQILLRNYMLERLLERISLSDYKDNFILKGGMLVAALVGVDIRSTIDMDATIKNYPVSLEAIEKAFNSIISVPIDDGITMTIKKIDEIRDEDEYSGFRVSLDAKLDNARITVKVDITTADKITPKEVIYKFDLLLEDRSIEILAYNIETVLAEKIETIISRSIANTRMRDFYDIYILLELQIENIDFKVLSKAIINTAEKRNTRNVISEGDLILDEIFSDENMLKSWANYQLKYSYAEGISWEEIKESVYMIWKKINIKKRTD